MLSDEQLLRYSRHIMLSGVDIEGQERLRSARVLVIGAGGLGCPVVMYLAGAGVGNLIINDYDKVDVSNLQRQIGHTDKDIGKFKVDSLAESACMINSDTKVSVLSYKLSKDKLLNEVNSADLVVDCSDNFTTRYQINQACVTNRTPLVYGAASGFTGQVAVFGVKSSMACYACLYPGLESYSSRNCSESGVLASVVGVIGSLQATESLKLLMGIGKPLTNRLMIFNALACSWQSFKMAKNTECSVCNLSNIIPRIGAVGL